jgi:hypothetical protein
MAGQGRKALLEAMLGTDADVLIAVCGDSDASSSSSRKRRTEGSRKAVSKKKVSHPYFSSLVAC